MRKVFVMMVVGIFSLSLFGLTYGDNGKDEVSDTYWVAVENNDIQMTDEEYIANFTKVVPIHMSILFSTENVLDGIHYGKFYIDYSYVTDCYNNEIGKGENFPIVSDKKVSNGLYDSKYPMVKTDSERNDIKWFYHPATNCFDCVFFKFSVDNYESEWISIKGLPPRSEKSIYKPRFIKKFEANLSNTDEKSFKIKGIRVIYNCDYSVIQNNLNQAYNFVNGDKNHSPELVAAGAKVMELKDSVFDKVKYTYKDEKGEAHPIEFVSYDKLNFEDKMTARKQQ